MENTHLSIQRKDDNRIYIVFTKDGKEKWAKDITDEAMELVLQKLFEDRDRETDDTIVIRLKEERGRGEFIVATPKS